MPAATASTRPPTLPRARATVGDWLAAALILAAFALLTTAHLAHYPLAVMAGLGLLQICRDPHAWAGTAVRTLLGLFALIWVPMLLALVDAVHLERSAKTVLLYLHFLPAAFFVMRACARPAVFRLVTQGVVILVVCIGLDAFAQLIWQRNLLGYPYDGRVLKGVFHPKQRLGLFLAVFAPLAIEVVRHWSREFPRLWLLYLPFAIVLLMSLKRSAWLMLAVGLAAYAALRWERRAAPGSTARRFLPWLLLTAVTVGAVGLNPALRNQLGTVAGLVSGDAATFDRASSYRLTLWRTGFDMFQAHWLNGVGPRGYRYAYADFAATDDFWMARNGRGQTHPHLVVLEVGAETGVIGLSGLFGFYALLLVLIRRLRDAAGGIWLLCAGVAWLPFNAHLAFYGSYWSTLAWLLLACGLGALARPELTTRVRPGDAPVAP